MDAELAGVRGAVPTDQGAAEPVRVGGQQGRPVRRLRAGGHAAHRRPPLAAAARGPRRHQGAAGVVPGPQGPGGDPGAALNQLRCNLELALPGAIGLFSRPDSPITLAFLRRFPTAAKVAWLSPVRCAGWLRSVGYTGGIPADVLYARLTDAAPGLDGAEGEARGAITLALVDTVEMLNAQIAGIEERIGALFASASRPAHLRQPAPVRDGARGEPARRDRRLPAEVPHRRRARCAGRRVAVDPAVRQTRPDRVPLVVQQEAPRRGDGLRQRQPRRRPVGRRRLPARRSTAAAATPTPSASSPAPGSASSGAAGKTAPPSTPPSTQARQPLAA